MTLANQLHRQLPRLRAIPGRLGLRPHSVTILAGTWSGTATGKGTETTAAVDILEAGNNPKVRWLTDEELALGASIGASSIEIGPLTPVHDIGATELGTLSGALLSTGQTLTLRVTGPQHPTGALYKLVRLRTDSALHYTLTASPA